jgi:hypothetical protein
MLTFERLIELRNALPEDPDLPFATTKREQEEIARQRIDLDRRLRRARAALDELAACKAADPDPNWIDFLRVARDTLTSELMAIATDRKAFPRRHVLTLSVHVIDRGPDLLTNSGFMVDTLPIGDLMKAAGHQIVGADPLHNYSGEIPWPSGAHGLHDLERVIKANDRRRARAQAQLDEALMDDEEREARDAEAVRQRKVLDELRIKHDPSGRPRPRDAEGNFLDPADLTEDQRAAFEKVYAS